MCIRDRAATRPPTCPPARAPAPRTSGRTRRGDRSSARERRSARLARRASPRSARRRSQDQRPGCSGAESLDYVEDLGGVTARTDAVGGVADDALLVDDEGRAHQALAAHAFRLLL